MTELKAATVPLGELTERITSGSRAWRTRLGSGTGRFLLTQCVRDGALDLSAAPAVNAPADKEAERTRVRQDDILITIVGEVGRVALVRDDPGEAYVSQSVALVRLNGGVNPQYLETYLRSPVHGQAYFDEKQYGVGRGHLLLSHLRDLPVVLPRLEEQVRIVEHVQGLLSQVDAIEDILRTNLKRASMLRKSILRRAVDESGISHDG
jgi:type I restriction enzyme S subunit